MLQKLALLQKLAAFLQNTVQENANYVHIRMHAVVTTYHHATPRDWLQQ